MKWTQEEVVKVVNEIHPNLKILNNYKNAKTPLLLEDEIGIQYLSLLSNLIKGKVPSILSAVNKTTAFKIKLSLIQPNLKVLSDYVNSQSKILVKDNLGIEYLVKPNNLLQGFTPTLKSAKDKNKAFIIKAKLIHKDKYDYSKINYVNKNTKIKIICPSHGEFDQTPENHLQKKGCNKCGNESISRKAKEYSRGWSYTDWRDMGENSNKFDSFKVYILEIWNDEENFYKIGKTFHTIGSRFGSGNNTRLPYNYKVFKIIEGSSLIISMLEKELQNKHKKYTFTPRIKFNGMHECFSYVNVNYLEGLQLIDDNPNNDEIKND